jgi:hypothetical protein
MQSSSSLSSIHFSVTLCGTRNEDTKYDIIHVVKIKTNEIYSRISLKRTTKELNLSLSALYFNSI